MGKGIGASSQIGPEGELGQHGGAGDLHVGAGGGKPRFCCGNVWTAGEQLAGHAAANGGPLQGVDRVLAGG